MDDKKIYELSYLILPSVPEDGLPSVVEKIKSAISEVDGVGFDGEEPFKIDLAYTMSKIVGASKYVVSDAYIGWTKFELAQDKIEDLRARVAKIDEVLRFLIVEAPRETTFTFAKAKAAIAEKLEKASLPAGGNEESSGEDVTPRVVEEESVVQ